MEQTVEVSQQTIDNLKSNLLKDRVSFHRAYNDFINFVPLFVNQNNHGDHKSQNEEFIGSNSVKPVTRKFNEDNTRELMLVTELSRKITLGDVLRSPTPPKYGLPGLGEYDEKRKTFLRERKKDYINYLNEQQNAKPRRRPNANEKLLDYEGLLAQKRREEYDYRHMTNDPYMINGVIKPAKSDSNVSNIPNWSNPEFTVDQNYDGYKVSIDHGFPSRPHSYPPEFNLGVFSNAEYERDGPSDGLQDSGRRPTTNIHLFSYKTDPMSRRQPLIDLSPGRWKPEEEKRAEYQAELKKQVEESQQRRAKIKEDEEKLNKRLEEENRYYDPWGRDGGGAPRRDRYGKVIASRCQIDNYKRDQIINGNAKVPPDQINSRRPSRTEEAEANYAIPRSPTTSRSPPVIRDERRNVDSYKDELKRQIEEKKLKQQLEKELERLEDEKLAQRIKDQQDKMQREYEEEQKKHRIREDERRRRNEDLQRRQDEQKKETNRRRREVLDEERRSHWEAREKALGRQSNSDQLLEKSPPLPSIKTKQNSIYTEEARKDSKGSVGLSSQKQPQSASRNHILTQLSTMRQQLEREQQQIQEQLKKQREGSYENYNQPNQNGRYEEQISDNISDDHDQHERWTERNDVREPTNKTSLNSPSIYRPATGQLKQEESDHKMLPVPEEVTHRERRIAPKVNTVRKMLPATALSLRSLDGFTPLQGESLFLGVDGYDLAPTNRWRQQNRRGSKSSELNGALQTDHYDGDRLADQEAARRRYLHTVNNDPDEVNADSFLDEYLARNIRK